MACCGSKPLPTPGTGVARGVSRGQTLVYRIMNADDECITENGQCLQFNLDSAAYQAWQDRGRIGYVRATWV